MTKDLPSQKITVITGPSATGKTKLAISKAIKNNAEIIYADSRAVYKGFDIVSAKPSKDELNQVPHHLIDIIEPDKIFSAGDFVQNAKSAITDIQSRGKNVIICGGTWFYIKSLLGEKKLPDIKRNDELRKELSEFSSEYLWQMLYNLDFERANTISKNDKEKIIRSIEMVKALNMPISKFELENNEKYDVEWNIIELDREKLYENINSRVDFMVKMGLYNEFLKNVELWGKDNNVIKTTIGYKEFLENENFDEAIDKIKQHTRNFAKRQMTFFRSFKP